VHSSVLTTTSHILLRPLWFITLPTTARGGGLVRAKVFFRAASRVRSGFVFNTVHQTTLPLASPGILIWLFMVGKVYYNWSTIISTIDFARDVIGLWGLPNSGVISCYYVTQSVTLLLESSWHPANILDQVTETINNRTEPLEGVAGHGDVLAGGRRGQ
jgi:hypothetical protein